MRYRSFLFAFALLWLACGQSGPCDYDIIDTQAEIVAIDAYSEDGMELYHVRMEFEASGLAMETQTLNELKEFEIDADFLQRNTVVVGNIYTCTVSERTSGDCTPLIVSFNHHFKL